MYLFLYTYMHINSTECTTNTGARRRAIHNHVYNFLKKKKIKNPILSKVKIIVTHNLLKLFQLTRLTYHSIFLR